MGSWRRWTHLAEALTTRRPAAADAALLALARADGVHDGLVDTLEAAGEAVRLSPQRRGALGGLDRYAVAAGQLGRVIEDVRALRARLDAGDQPRRLRPTGGGSGDRASSPRAPAR